MVPLHTTSNSQIPRKNGTLKEKRKVPVSLDKRWKTNGKGVLCLNRLSEATRKAGTCSWPEKKSGRCLLALTSAGRQTVKAFFALTVCLKRLERLAPAAGQKRKAEAPIWGIQSKNATSCRNDCMTTILWASDIAGRISWKGVLCLSKNLKLLRSKKRVMSKCPHSPSTGGLFTKSMINN
ncbi:hypothetical protein SAMN05421832_11743 [Psychrobacillus psychrodurans]|nr:hypothetical protein SAMN05421832_11743 [Psychrobacillus psychrodurans]